MTTNDTLLSSLTPKKRGHSLLLLGGIDTQVQEKSKNTTRDCGCPTIIFVVLLLQEWSINKTEIFWKIREGHY